MGIKVTLRKKKISKDRSSFYLDFYPPIANPKTGEPTRREFLGLYYLDKPKNYIERNHNAETKMTAEQRRQNRDNEVNKPEIYTLHEKEQLRLKERAEQSFVKYFKELTDQRKHSNHDNWVSSYNYLLEFTDGSLNFGELTERFCDDFKRYLLNAKSHRSEKSKLGQNSASSYYNKFRAALKQAYRDGYLIIDIAERVAPIKPQETRRNYLTLEELQMLAKCEVENKVLKRAGLFSALTGMRYSDIVKLTWGEVEQTKEGCSVHFKQQKTKGVEVLPLTDEAVTLLGSRQEHTEKVFKGLNDRDRYYFFALWVAKAGIKKEVTFHCLRHTFATLQLNSGTSIYTVSKLLGHRELKTTQIYAKIMDQTKREAVNRIKLDL